VFPANQGIILERTVHRVGDVVNTVVTDQKAESTCGGVVMVLLWCRYGVDMVLSWCCHGVVMVFSWCCYGVVMALSWELGTNNVIDGIEILLYCENAVLETI